MKSLFIKAWAETVGNETAISELAAICELITSSSKADRECAKRWIKSLTADGLDHIENLNRPIPKPARFSYLYEGTGRTVLADRANRMFFVSDCIDAPDSIPTGHSDAIDVGEEVLYGPVTVFRAGTYLPTE